MKSSDRNAFITRPSVWNLLGEIRWVGEWVAGSLRREMTDLPEGDGHAVLLLPGFLASDRSLAPLARTLRRLGYITYRSGFNPNPGPTRPALDWLRGRVVEVMERAETPISIVGQSLGGIYAREIARNYPSRVRCVITMGSPFQAPENTNASLVATALGRFWGREERESRPALSEPLTVPTTSVFSRSDGVVPWEACIEAPGPQRENIEVRTSHIGMAVHPAVIRIVADRLALPRGGWRPYASSEGSAGTA
ncbi:MAG: alpha/beta fold hydrolase [Deltaproteobacteria bacterium]|nr:alpha/beta fold hydrolase [Deltaproteobacteria bacterium]